MTKSTPHIPVLYEDNNLVMVNKPAGLLVHAVHGKKQTPTQEPTVVDWLREHYPEANDVGDEPLIRAGIVHRLDKDTSGVMVMALNQQTFEYLKGMFQERKMEKAYLAVVRGVLTPARGRIDKPIGIVNGTTRRSTRAKGMRMIREAVTDYDTVKAMDSMSLVRVWPRTGRTHQIRVHFAAVGHPVVGDSLYGKQGRGDASRMMLHAESLSFDLPNGKRLSISADPPEDFIIVREST